jgi:DNA polymerase III epsilon subunit family exonuclease
VGPAALLIALRDGTEAVRRGPAAVGAPAYGEGVTGSLEIPESHIPGIPGVHCNGLPAHDEPHPVAVQPGAPWGGRRAGLPEDVPVVIVDVETTGLLPQEATIIEIGAVRLAGTRVTGEFFSLVNPGVPVPPDISELTGITDELVRPAPAAAAALAAFLAFAEGAVLVAHHAPFDLAFLSGGSLACGLPWPAATVLDTAVLARLVLDGEQVPDCKLATLAGYFGAATHPCHRALADARATADVLLGLLGELSDRRAAGLLGECDLPGSREMQAEYGLLPAGPPVSSPSASGEPAAGGPAAGGPVTGGPVTGGPPVVLLAATQSLSSGRLGPGLRGLPLYATAAAGARVPGEPRRRPWSPLSS